jgi:hypothetical protein
MFKLGKKKDSDKGFNKFQILVASLRSKLRNAQQMYDLAWRALARSIELGRKTEIKSKTHNEFRQKQQVTYLQEACDLAHIVYKNYSDLFAENPSKEIQDKYVELCTYREVVNVPALGEFWFNNKIPGNDEAKQFFEFDESTIASYLRTFAETHGVNQRGFENLENLFPEENLLNQIPLGMPLFPPPGM